MNIVRLKLPRKWEQPGRSIRKMDILIKKGEKECIAFDSGYKINGGQNGVNCKYIKFPQ